MAITYLSRVNPKILKGIALLRLDFNTEDDWRLVAAIPTIRFLLGRASKVVIISHKGRPPVLTRGFYGAIPASLKKFSLKADSVKLKKLLKKQVHFIPRFDFKTIKDTINNAPRGSIFLLENLRFMKGETENSREFAKKLASLADFYVNDAFAVSHRADASVAAIAEFLPSFCGLEFENEIFSLSRAMENPKHPLVLILGGGKVKDKLGILKYFKHTADYFLIGGVAASTILFLKGVDVGKSVIEKNPAELKKLRSVLGYKNLLLPADFKRGSGGAMWDIGKKTSVFFSRVIKKARTIIWSGPFGLIEKKSYAVGSLAIARAIVSNKRAFSIAGGGETVMFLKKHKLDKKFSFISTGGGAMLEFLEGKKLPGIEALRKK